MAGLCSLSPGQACKVQAQHAVPDEPTVPSPPRRAARRAWVGDVPGLAPPLQDPEHAFNTYYRQVRAVGGG